ncbi:olfactory receptor 52A1-like isoform X2 [Xiphophorus maculatus]|uniref:olfactory receptor 52A1-like isoform X2 n=1 Tax=Xiphophorus maculatus TaxID=8083 RepID=UPI000C6CC22B|nr:olfactory receptor 52A1-like isoform X2 [Xiphophorus maculatus]
MNGTEGPSMIQIHVPVRVLLTVLPCLFFLYVNSVMLFALVKKPLLLESPRYILFGHLLFSDFLQFTAITVKMSPINLAVMSLERFVAICFPLRHAAIATSRVTRGAIAVMWTVASLDSFTQLCLFFSLGNRSLTAQQVCRKKTVFQLQVYVIVNQVFTVANFVLVTVIIIYTYIATMVAVKCGSSCAHRAKVAHQTVILHALQLCLYLISTLFNMINSSDLFNLDPGVALYVNHLLFLGLIIFPKFLSSLLYGLKDQTFKHVFKYYFTFGYRSSVEPYPTS